IDTNEYLRRFIDIEYSIPEPEPIKFFNYLYDYYDFNSFFKSQERLQYNELQNDSDNFRSISKIFLNGLTLRQQEKILSHSRIVLRTINYDNYLVPFFFVFMIFIKDQHRKYYDKLISKRENITEIHDEFFSIIKPYMNSENKRFFLSLEGYLLIYYQNYISPYKLEVTLYNWISETKSYKLNISSKINDEDLLNFFNKSNGMSSIYDLSLEYFIKKIELTEDIKIN
ncbi:MAG: NTPase, partial [Flavobacterium sp.]